MKAATTMGFSKSEAELLVGQTFKGAVDLINKSEDSCETWVKRVASRGGTTEAALKSFLENKVHKDIQAAAEAALNRAEELGN
jgi:Pyrroline-5-carboxylate reductase